MTDNRQTTDHARNKWLWAKSLALERHF